MKTLIFVLLLVGLTFGNNLNLDLNPKCEGIEDGRFIKDWDRGCDAWIQCIEGFGFPGRCPAGYFFSEERQLCDWPENVDCGVAPTTEPEPETTTDSEPETTTEEEPDTTTEDRPDSTTEAEPETTTEEEPDSTTEAEPETTTEEEPDSTTEEEPDTTTEEEPDTTTEEAPDTTTEEEPDSTTEEEPDTTTEEEPETTTEEEPETTTDPEPAICEPNQLYTLPHPSKCSKYIMCMDGVATERSCSPGFHYSTKLSQCIQQDQANCIVENPVCPEIDDPYHPTFFAHPYDCHRFYVCHRGDLIPLKCTANNHWNQKHEWCVSPKDSKCKDHHYSDVLYIDFEEL